jgi:hypothetical protein
MFCLLELFCLATVLATFQKMGEFLSDLLVTLIALLAWVG